MVCTTFSTGRGTTTMRVSTSFAWMRTGGLWSIGTFGGCQPIGCNGKALRASLVLQQAGLSTRAARGLKSQPFRQAHEDSIANFANYGLDSISALFSAAGVGDDFERNPTDSHEEALAIEPAYPELFLAA